MNKVLNIGIDARYLALPNCGIGRYTANLVREFATQELAHRIFLYSDRPFKLPIPLPDNWKVRIVDIHYIAFTVFFEQIVFPAWAWKDAIDVFWSPINHLPVLLPPKIRKVLTVHDVTWKRFPQTMPWRGRVIEAVLLPRSLQIADHVIADSQFTRSEILAFYPDTRCTIDVVYLASSLKSDGATGSCPVPGPYFLFVGSKEPRKNIKRLLEAYIQYRKATSDPIALVIAGAHQWGEFSVADFIRINGLQACVHLIQNADDTVLRALYANAQALVMVSLYEGFGLPLVEAMQWDIPLIASNNSSVAEIAGNAGMLVDPYDTDAISRALTRMTEDETARLELALRAKTRGRRFSWKQTASETMALLVSGLATSK
jgi:glycosyltransferase involved in cell wall biosynthesis